MYQSSSQRGRFLIFPITAFPSDACLPVTASPEIVDRIVAAVGRPRHLLQLVLVNTHYRDAAERRIWTTLPSLLPLLRILFPHGDLSSNFWQRVSFPSPSWGVAFLTDTTT